MLDFTETDGLFDNFEVNREPFWPRIIWLIAGSGAWHAVLVACIILIPAVRDALSLAVLFSGAGFVDRDYNKTQIENEGDITEITLEKFHYPAGYFAMDAQAMPSPEFPPPAPFTPRVFSPSQLADPSPTPAPSPVASPSPAIAANATPTPNASPNAEDEKEKQRIEEELDRLAKENGVKRPKEINTRPFKDLLAAAKKKKDSGELKLDGRVELTVEADRDPDGKLRNAKVADKRGDKKLEAIALDFISALSDSGVLDFLEDTKHLRVTVKIDDKTVEVVASSEVDSTERARQLERTFNGMIVLGRIVKRGEDEETYYNHTEVSSKEKEVSVKFSMPRAEMGALLSKYAEEKK
jgi:outer membrane biosynthesis protein TonB